MKAVTIQHLLAGDGIYRPICIMTHRLLGDPDICKLGLYHSQPCRVGSFSGQGGGMGSADLQGDPIFFIWCPYIRYKSRGAAL